MVNLQEFKENVENLLNQLHDEINVMPDKGLTSDESQKIGLINAIYDVHYLLNGTTEEDLLENIDEEE